MLEALPVLVRGEAPAVRADGGGFLPGVEVTVGGDVARVVEVGMVGPDALGIAVFVEEGTTIAAFVVGGPVAQVGGHPFLFAEAYPGVGLPIPAVGVGAGGGGPRGKGVVVGTGESEGAGEDEV